MAIALRTQTTLASGITQTTVVSALLTAFTNAGYNTPVDNYTSGTDRILVYSFVVDSTKTFGTVYYRVRITSALSVFVQLYTAWNTTTKVGANASGEFNPITLTTTSTISFDALNGSSEYKFVVITQSTTSIILGVIAPANKPTWFDLNTFPYGFMFSNSSINTLIGCGLNPYSNVSYSTSLNNSLLALANTQTNARDILTGVMLFSASTRGIGGRTSDDVVSASASGTSKFDVLAVPGSSNQYLVINNVSGGIAFRIA
jgi:hypothetical protein